MSNKRQTAFRLSETARELLRALAEEMGVTMVAALEVVIRESAKRRGLPRQ